ncbi:MAG: tRNA lysidine(34) synthetase TilS [Clostridia bacterium]|nr:tRNA lysidine(34) synthetase TilS [Clostridia bacterium]
MLAEKVKNFITANKLFTETDSVLVAFSGGADSMCLLHILKTLSYNVSAAHFNHMLRGEESFKDEKASADFCKSLNIPFFLHRANIAEIAKSEGISEETAGRQERYRFFRHIASENGISKIATAHNLNDNAETVLMHLIRGCSTDGLSGIPKCRDNIVRPLLSCSRNEIEDYCEHHGLPYVTDSTNLESIYTRNKIRHELLPVLAEFNPNILSALTTLSDTALADKEFFSSLTYDLIGTATSVPTEKLTPLPNSLLTRAVARLGSNAGLSCEHRHIISVANFIRCEKPGKICVPGGYFESSCGIVSALTDATGGFYHSISPTGTIQIKGYTLSSESEITSDCYFVLPADGKIAVRSRKSGDRIRVRGMTKKLSDLFIDKKIPASRRDEIPLLTLNDEIIYVFGVEKSDLTFNFENNISTFVLNISNKEYTNEQ